MHLLNLPTEILFYITTFLNVKEVILFSNTSSQLQFLSKNRRWNQDQTREIFFQTADFYGLHPGIFNINKLTLDSSPEYDNGYDLAKYTDNRAFLEWYRLNCSQNFPLIYDGVKLHFISDPTDYDRANHNIGIDPISRSLIATTNLWTPKQRVQLLNRLIKLLKSRCYRFHSKTKLNYQIISYCFPEATLFWDRFKPGCCFECQNLCDLDLLFCQDCATFEDNLIRTFHVDLPGILKFKLKPDCTQIVVYSRSRDHLVKFDSDPTIFEIFLLTDHPESQQYWIEKMIQASFRIKCLDLEVDWKLFNYRAHIDHYRGHGYQAPIYYICDGDRYNIFCQGYYNGFANEWDRIRCNCKCQIICNCQNISKICLCKLGYCS